MSKVIRKARISHICNGCQKIISSGEDYEDIKGLVTDFDVRIVPMRGKRCSDCIKNGTEAYMVERP